LTVAEGGGAWSGIISDVSGLLPQAPLPPQILMDAAGNATVVWTKSNADPTVVQSAHYSVVSGAWSSVTDLSSAASGVRGFRTVMDRFGNVTAIWLTDIQDPDGFGIQIVRYSSATGNWGNVFSFPGDTQFVPAITVDDAGNVTLAWDDFWQMIRSIRYDINKNQWGLAVDIGGTGSNPVIAADSAGNVTAAWGFGLGSTCCSTDGGSIQAARYTSDTGSWGEVTNLSDPRQYPFQHALAIDPFGNVTVVWVGGTALHKSIQSSRYVTASNAWSPATYTPICECGMISTPRLASDSLGNVTVVWGSFDEPNSWDPVQALRYDKSLDAWTSVVNLTAELGNQPRLVVDANGNVTVMWTRFPCLHVLCSAPSAVGTDHYLETARYTISTGVWSGVVDLATSTAISPPTQPVVDGSDDVTAAWTFGPAGQRVIQSSRYSVGDATWGSVIGLSPTTEDADASRLAVDGSGNVIAVWRALQNGSYVIQATRWVAGL
jgi:hypothetical protein